MLRRRLLQGAAALGLIPFLPRLAEANVLNVVGEATVSGKPPHLDHWFISLNSVEPIPDKLLGWKKINSVEACGLIENTLKDLKKHYGNRAVHSAKLPIPEDLPGVECRLFKYKGLWVRETQSYSGSTDWPFRVCWDIGILNLSNEVS